ncbi:MAG: hypothetical protein REJ24_13210 [Rhodocyclaceae bacterium]|nr:hypothetical protein [Pseudomonadota bacterium]MDQ7973521.1 hypothetical protein [Rhodocyclaceae bacterium]MDQ7998427.1 hypothetical protein [Pseudomonadota bacterium]MDQ8016288.1 hypothetical protein [Pseudomonadota bacterium]
MNQSIQDSWWHERQTRPADLSQAPKLELYRRPKGNEVWIKAGLVVGLMLALILTVIGAVAR